MKVSEFLKCLRGKYTSGAIHDRYVNELFVTGKIDSLVWRYILLGY